MTDKEIAKAFSICKNDGGILDCGECPYNDVYVFSRCINELMSDAYDLIKRQEARIKELEERCNNK